MAMAWIMGRFLRGKLCESSLFFEKNWLSQNQLVFPAFRDDPRYHESSFLVLQSNAKDRTTLTEIHHFSSREVHSRPNSARPTKIKTDFNNQFFIHSQGNSLEFMRCLILEATSTEGRRRKQ